MSKCLGRSAVVLSGRIARGALLGSDRPLLPLASVRHLGEDLNVPGVLVPIPEVRLAQM